MDLPNPNSPQALTDEILAQAQRQQQEIIARAEQEAKSLLAQAAAEAAASRRDRLQQAQAESARRVELLLATVRAEAGRLRAAGVEALLQGIREEIARRLQARRGIDYRETLISLTVEAMRQMSGEEFLVKLSPADALRFAQGFTQETACRIGGPPVRITLVEDATLADGGVVVQDATGRQVWDNRFTARLERLWPELRRQIAVQTGLIGSTAPPESRHD